MHQSEAEQCQPCVACGAEVSPRDRTYALGNDDLLCFACSTARQGIYDEGEDRWLVAPHIADLLRRAEGLQS